MTPDSAEREDNRIPPPDHVQDQPRTILLVEDEEAIRQLITSSLEAEGYRIVAAANGRDAEALFDDSIDLLLTDIRLPFMDGRVLIRHLRSRRQSLKVVAISGHDMNAPTDPDVVFLAKPFTSDQLFAAVRTVFARG